MIQNLIPAHFQLVKILALTKLASSFEFISAHKFNKCFIESKFLCAKKDLFIVSLFNKLGIFSSKYNKISSFKERGSRFIF